MTDIDSSKPKSKPTSKLTTKWKTKWSTKLLMVGALIVWAVVVAKTDLGWLETWVYGAPSAQQIHPIGAVTAVHFVGGWGYDTQIDTASHSVLVSGIATMEHGVRLETRTGYKDTQVCVVGSSTCWHWMGQ